MNNPVFIPNFNKTPAWLNGLSVEQTGPVSYKVKLGNDNIVKCHVDHICARMCADSFDDWPATVTDCANEADSPPPPANPLSTTTLTKEPQTSRPLLPISLGEGDVMNCDHIYVLFSHVNHIVTYYPGPPYRGKTGRLPLL